MAENPAPAGNSVSADQLPLRLAAFERMMIVDDRDDYPMLSEVELHFSGAVDPTRLTNSLNSAVARHPLLMANLKTGPAGKMLWVLPARAPVVVDIRTVEAAAQTELRVELGRFRSRIDLTQNSGVRFLIVNRHSGFDLHVAVHHACCDGGGMFQLIHDILLLYHNFVVNSISGQCEDVELPPLRHSSLKRRGYFSVGSNGVIALLKETAFGFHLAKRFGNEKPVRLLARQDKTESKHTTAVSAPDNDFSELLRPLRRAAAALSVTLNDLLIRDLFLAMENWNTTKTRNMKLGDTKQQGKNECYRLMMPCSLRTANHSKLSAANVMSFSFLSRTANDISDSEKLLAGVKSETEYIRNENASLYFIRSLQAASWIPNGIGGVAEAGKCMATALLSNVADPMRALSTQLPRNGTKLMSGDLTLERIDARPPLRPQTRLGFVVNTYANQLIIGTAFDGHYLSTDDAREFLTLFRQYLEQTVKI